MAAFAMINTSYQSNQVQTAGPGQLLVMAYDGMIRFLREAQRAMEQHDYEAQNRYIQKTQALLLELQRVLDYEASPELATCLNNLYWWMYEKLTQANVKDDVQMLMEISRQLAELREAWAIAAQQSRTSEPRQMVGGRC